MLFHPKHTIKYLLFRAYHRSSKFYFKILFFVITTQAIKPIFKGPIMMQLPPFKKEVKISFFNCPEAFKFMIDLSVVNRLVGKPSAS